MSDTAQIIGSGAIVLILGALKFDILETSRKCEKSIKEYTEERNYYAAMEFEKLQADIQKADFIWWIAVVLILGVILF